MKKRAEKIRAAIAALEVVIKAKAVFNFLAGSPALSLISQCRGRQFPTEGNPHIYATGS